MALKLRPIFYFQLHSPETNAGRRRPFVEVAVVMRQERIGKRWLHPGFKVELVREVASGRQKIWD